MHALALALLWQPEVHHLCGTPFILAARTQKQNLASDGVTTGQLSTGGHSGSCCGAQLAVDGLASGCGEDEGSS